MKSTSNNTKKLLLSIISLFSVSILKAADMAPAASSANTASAWSNGPTILMLCTIVILMCVLFIVGKIVKTLIEEDTLETARKNKSSKGLIMLLALSILSISVEAQDAAVTVAANSGPSMIFGMESMVFWIMFGVLIFEFISIMVLCYVLYVYLLRKGLVKPLFENIKLPKLLQWNAMMGNDIPLEKDEELLTEHDYDGIQELDNGMPPFLKYLFIITIVFAAYYLVDYQVLKSSPSQLEEYQIELEQGEAAKLEYLKIAGASVDENTVTLTEDAGMLATGAKLYATNCVACHGDKGQGGVGPNLTDNYWLHGGTINNIFKTIKSGIPDKGMRAWESEIKPADIQAISSFILKTFGGTNVAGGKEPQGELAGAAAATGVVDSTSTPKADSTASMPKP